MSQYEGKSIIYSREELYDLVWTTPMRTLAKKFGLSDQGLAKKCKKHNIPRPPVGYWAKIEHGKKVTKPPLPKLADPQLQRIELSNQPIVTKESISKINLVTNDDPRIILAREFVVPDRISRYHHVVQRSKQEFKNRSQDRYGFLQLPRSNNNHLNLKVTQSSIDRAHRFVELLIRLIKEFRWQLGSNKERHQDHSISSIKVDDEVLFFRIKEKIIQKDLIPTTKEKDRSGFTPFPRTVELRVISFVQADQVFSCALGC
ncbi:MAG: hypothetical protein AB2697_04345, partial [Candidatus Thiodiazotropha endolucinida]